MSLSTALLTSAGYVFGRCGLPSDDSSSGRVATGSAVCTWCRAWRAGTPSRQGAGGHLIDGGREPVVASLVTKNQRLSSGGGWEEELFTDTLMV